MQLSVIIVNYNVCFFLEQCLATVEAAGEALEMEVIVVDNASTDGSMEYLPAKFPRVQFIRNAGNLGFAKANNQAMEIARGKYLLLLNPDTLVTEKAFRTSMAFFESHADAGCIGMRMFDGRGHFLPESKRGFPTSMNAFFRLSGLSTIFPQSSIFSGYYQGHLSPETVQEVEVLAGAYMMLRREVFEKVGPLDERFFMYGEDIDWSYRILKGGYINYYLPNPGIIHFKGESSSKDPSYIRHFYRAMQLFVEKHYGRHSRLRQLMLQQAINMRMLMARAGIHKGLWKKGAGRKIREEAMQWTLVGDADSIKEVLDGLPEGTVKAALPVPGDQRPSVDGLQQQGAYGLVLCVGMRFTMSAALDYLRRLSGGMPVRFHCLGTGSMVGSDDRNSSGHAIGLKMEPAV
ncbi:glycosyltransferase family 2 protein [Flavihumibacter sediminis]|nr:glycosyltransferase family 2 protein [Flavihumibacter sediminis]